jgi:hypothetical protein
MALPRPSDTAAVTLASLAVHAEELLSPGGHEADRAAIQGCLEHPEVKAYLAELDALSLLPLKRSAVRGGGRRG